MSSSCEKLRSRPCGVAVSVFVFVLATPLLSCNSAAEIPHENYDLIGSDMDLVVVMLNSSIRASEDALRSFYDQNLESAQGYLDMVASVVEPAAVILDEIEEIAPSHEQLSVLIPPFSSFGDEMREFAELEGSMLAIKDEITAIAMGDNISDVDAIAVIESVRELNIVLSEMNDTVDAMLVKANEISSLTVADRYAFVPNELSELIESLRELTSSMHEEIAELIEEGIPWQDNRSYLLLWIADAELYLGETLSGGGYLICNGTSVAGSLIDVVIDESTFALVNTSGSGSFSFGYDFPVNASWLGVHKINATAQLPGETITSDTLWITVSLVPTKMVLRLSNSTISLSEELRVEAVLTREPNLPLPGFDCALSVDGSSLDFLTDADGESAWVWKGSELGIGTHVFSASFPETLPFAPCDSGDKTVTVDVPTQLTLNLFSDRLRSGYYLVGDGLLQADMPSLPRDQKITLSIDGAVVMNVSTNLAGEFAFSIETEGMEVGTHVLTAQFIDRDPYWRSSEDHEKFSIIGFSSSDYPFLPWIPGWDVGGGMQEQIQYLFFGEYAYFTWLFVILVVGVVIKALQVRKRKSISEAEPESIAAKGKESSGMVSRDGTIVPREHMPDWLVSPNEKIIWHYHNLLAFLKCDFRMGIADNMTHWEVANLIESLGYPRGDAAKVALLYEKAQYSGIDSSEDEVLQMNSSSFSIRRSGGVRPAF